MSVASTTANSFGRAPVVSCIRSSLVRNVRFLTHVGQTNMRAITIALLISCTAVAQGAGPEDFRIEVTASGWRTGVQGQVQASGVPVDLQTDLALADTWTFTGKLVVKPGRRHRIYIEGAPYAFEGQSTLSRSIVYAGRTYVVSEPVSSRAELTYVAAGYQFDFVSRPSGHLGVQISGAYLDAFGSITAVNRGITGVKQQTIGLPLAGIEGRTFLVPHRRWVFVEGEVKGMGLGSYGRYIQGGGFAGFGAGPLSFRAGYQVLDADVHDKPNTSGIRPRISGPVIGAQLRF